MLHVIQHVPFETCGSIQHWADVRTVDVQVIHPYAGDALPQVGEHDSVVLMGGPMSVNDAEALPWFAEEIEWTKALLSSKAPILGICLGGQILAKALGARVLKNEEREIGWYPVNSHENREATQLDESLPQRMPVFHWHSERFEIPEGAIPIYSSEGCKEQAFLYQGRALALQFHLEILPDTVEALIEACANEMIPGPYVQTVNEIRAKTGQHLRNAQHQMFTILDQLFTP